MFLRTLSLAVSYFDGTSIQFVDDFLADFLYGNRDAKDLDTVFNDLKWYDTLLGWTKEQWSDLITR